MSATYVRDYYGVPAKRLGRVRLGGGFSHLAGREGTIVSFPDQYIGVRLDGDVNPLRFHPTWELTYLAPDGSVLWPKAEEAS